MIGAAALGAGLSLALAGWVCAQSVSYAGLWIGEVSVDGVSEANPSVADLSFDLSVQARLIEETLIASGDAWRYDDTGTDRGIAWRELAYNDSAWQQGQSQFGYGDGDEITPVLWGGNPFDKYPTTYFRKSFALADPAVYESLQFRVLRDDAVALYLNGVQILRQNLPTAFSYSTLALSAIEGTNEQAYIELTVPATLLGSNNVVAAEVHIVDPADTDMSFDLELLAVREEAGADTLLPIGSSWKYDAAGTMTGTAWRGSAFDDSLWLEGPAQLGYGDGDESTLIGFGAASNKTRATYFRHAFTVADPAAYSHLDLLLLRDDGAAIYLNGQELLRSNLPETGEITPASEPVQSVGAALENDYLLARVRSDALVAGTNVLEVSVHQHLSELGEVALGVPTPTWKPLDLRLILHVDTNDTVRLLKEVIQLWKEGSYTPVGDGFVLNEPGNYVLLTDDTLISQFSGVGLRDGQMVGRRISSVGFDFDALHLDMTGAFGPGNAVTVSNTLPATFRTNPFRHKFHPDHDNWDARYRVFEQEARTVTRLITLAFSTRYPANPLLPAETPPPGWGESKVGGLYSELLTGLHKNPISVSGSFELDRASGIPVLNE